MSSGRTTRSHVSPVRFQRPGETRHDPITIMVGLSTAMGLASGIRGMTSGGGGGGGGASQQDALRAAIARRTPDLMAQTGGGAAPQFTANLAAQDAGLPGMQMDALKELGNQFPGAAGGFTGTI